MRAILSKCYEYFTSYHESIAKFLVISPFLTGLLFLPLPKEMTEAVKALKEIMTLWVIFLGWIFILSQSIKLRLIGNSISKERRNFISIFAKVSLKERILTISILLVLTAAILALGQYSGLGGLSLLLMFFTGTAAHHMIVNFSPTPKYYIHLLLAAFICAGVLTCLAIEPTFEPAFFVVSTALTISALTPSLKIKYLLSPITMDPISHKIVRLLMISPPFLISLLVFTKQLNSFYLLTFIPLVISMRLPNAKSESSTILTANSLFFMLVILGCRFS